MLIFHPSSPIMPIDDSHQVVSDWLKRLIYLLYPTLPRHAVTGGAGRCTVYVVVLQYVSIVR